LNYSYPQGRILLTNGRAPTHLGSIDGPLAGPGIWGQFILGETTDELLPIAGPVEHIGNGVVHEFSATAPDIPPFTFVYVQFLAWDGTLWGTDFDLVPENQFGRTDAVRYYLLNDLLPLGVPQFTQSAVVPPIPEPTTWILLVFGFMGLVTFNRRRRWNRS
jgi:PEP-CTERM motif